MMIAASDLHNLEINRLLPRIRSAKGVEINLQSTVPPDLLATVMLRAALSYTHQTVTLVDAGQHPESSFVEHLLGWERGKSTELNTEYFPIVTPWSSRGMFCVPTFQFDYHTPATFTRQLASRLAASGVSLPPEVLAACGAIGYEAATNAEEHGSSVVGASNIEVFRVLCMTVHTSLRPTLGPLVTDYWMAHRRFFGWPQRGWVEMIVADAGMGIAYPNYYSSAQGRNSARLDLYTEPFDIERTWFEQTLRKKNFTTKGKWGKLLNSQSRPGMGMRIIRQRLTATHGVAIIRAGRSAATWKYLREKMGPSDWEEMPPYEVDEREYSAFHGTVWQVFVPITEQMELGIHG